MRRGEVPHVDTSEPPTVVVERQGIDAPRPHLGAEVDERGREPVEVLDGAIGRDVEVEGDVHRAVVVGGEAADRNEAHPMVDERSEHGLRVVGRVGGSDTRRPFRTRLVAGGGKASANRAAPTAFATRSAGGSRRLSCTISHSESSTGVTVTWTSKPQAYAMLDRRWSVGFPDRLQPRERRLRRPDPLRELRLREAGSASTLADQVVPSHAGSIP